MKTKYILALLPFVWACNNSTKEMKEEVEPKKAIDAHSYADPSQSKVTHLDWDAELNFESNTIRATATLSLANSSEATQLILDTKALTIEKVTLADGQETTFKLGKEDANLGRSLTIDIAPDTESVSILYTTSPTAEAVQWLNPTQTADKKAPFLFTQSQAILARSWVPIQDSPGIRFTYSAKVKVPSNLLALMSAENPTEKSADGVYTFKMEQPIPAYLLALSVGDLEFRSIGDRAGVYAEPSVIEAAAFEFEDLEDMIVAAEGLYGPYQWDRYDLIVLPPSFPFGGMENPRLTFATPTILAGDKSLTSLVAHELAHSWSGNLVTNATWDDFWLNEGFTVYFEQRIMEEVYGRDYSEMLASLSNQDLKEEIAEMTAKGEAVDTHLKLDLTGRNPDDGMTSIAYDKGYLFLRGQEELVGREKFDAFLKEYFTSNAFKVMTTEEFVLQLEDLYRKNELSMDREKIEAWIYGPGLPADAPQPSSNKFSLVGDQMDAFMSGTPASELTNDNWSSHEWLHFVRAIPEDLSLQKMTELDQAFGFTKSGNSEVLTAWLEQSIKHQYEPAYDRLEEFLISTGRRKFLMPLYRAMILTDEGKQMAKAIYVKARPNYHFVAYDSIDELLKE
ncbi:MAG: M1 family metallopeptidase [Cytophagales bacterium]|nr:M1 family metallopeptidase [Cytophagales bacterium]